MRLVFLVVGLIGLSSRFAAQTAPLWSYSTASEISVVEPSPVGVLVVLTKTALIALDPASGKPSWTREDVKDAADFYSLGPVPLGVVDYRNKAFEVVDLETGRTQWSAASLPLGAVRSTLPLVERHLMLILGQSPENRVSLLAADLRTGVVRWRIDLGFVHLPKDLHPAWPVSTSDTTVMLYLTKDGPLHLHTGTGQVLWRGQSLRGKEVPSAWEPSGWAPGSRGYPPSVTANGVVFVPFERHLQALRLESGAPAWAKPPEFGSPITQLELTPRGLLVRGDIPPGRVADQPFIDLVDPQTGASVWAKRYENNWMSNFVVQGERVYVAAEGRARPAAEPSPLGNATPVTPGSAFVALGLADGTATELREFDFDGGETPWLLEPRGDGLLLLSSHNLMLVDTAGGQRYHAYHPAPGASLVTQIAKGVLFVGSLAAATAYGGFVYIPRFGVRQARSARVRDFMYMVAHEADSTGAKRPVFLKLNKDNGTVIGRVWLAEKAPRYVLDALSDMLYVKRGERELMALKL